MKNKLIAFSDQEITWVMDEAEKREITFSDMVRRIVDARYEKFNYSVGGYSDSDSNIIVHEFKDRTRDGTNG